MPRIDPFTPTREHTTTHAYIIALRIASEASPRFVDIVELITAIRRDDRLHEGDLAGHMEYAITYLYGEGRYEHR